MNVRRLSNHEFHNMIRNYTNELFAILILSPLPANGVCPGCQTTQWVNVELGYTRTSQMALADDGLWQVDGDGWDDMSEGGDDEFVECSSCGMMFEIPSDLRWT